MDEILLDVKDLVTEFYGEDGRVKAVDHVSFHVKKGEILGVVGESGCGKSVTSMSVMRLIPENLGRVAEGVITFEGKNTLDMSKKEIFKNYRKRNIHDISRAAFFAKSFADLWISDCRDNTVP